jgi:UDP-N-acetylglucosamine 2-epimerase
MKLAIIYGTRPEFLKLKVLIDTIKHYNINLKVIKINQHNSFNDDNGYFDEKIDIENYCDNRLSNIGSTILIHLPQQVGDRTHILTQGDTSTAY